MRPAPCLTGSEADAAARGSFERGYSLIELTIAMGLGVFLSGAMVFSYLGAKQSASLDAQVARVQENARYALELLTRELAMAGFRGALSGFGELVIPGVAGDCTDEPWALDFSRPLQWVNDVADGAPQTDNGDHLNCLRDASVMPSTDILAVRRSAAQPSARDGAAAPDLTRSSGRLWFLRAETGLATAWEFIRPRDLPGLAASSADTTYWEAVSRIFFIRDYARAPGDDLPALCMKVLAGAMLTTRCLVEGIENMQLEFGLDTDSDGSANQYVSAVNSQQMLQVVTARVHLLVRTIEPVFYRRDDKRYRLGVTVSAPKYDRHFRRVFSATVLLRNYRYDLG